MWELDLGEWNYYLKHDDSDDITILPLRCAVIRGLYMMGRNGRVRWRIKGKVEERGV